MPRKIILLILLLFPFIASADNFFPQANDDLEHDKFWAETYFKPDSNTAIMNFRVWFEAPPDKVYKILTDTNKLKVWLSNFKDSRTLSKTAYDAIEKERPADGARVIALAGNAVASDAHREPNQNWTDYIYFQFNFPWPLVDRWVVHKVRMDETNASNGEYKFEYKMTAGNFKALTGYWKLVPVENHPGWTEFRGEYASDPGIPVPKFVAKNAMKLGLKKDVENYRVVLKK